VKQYLLILFVFALTWGSTLATDLTWRPTSAIDRQLSPLDVISLNGQLNARDGVMVYTLKKDGSFSLLPLAMTGTWIRGKWKLESSSGGLRVQVEGSWGGVNQLSPNDQFTTLRLMIQPGVLFDTGHPETDIYKCDVRVDNTKYDFHLTPSSNRVPLPPAKMTFNVSNGSNN
jgi:hypothetical protein